MPVHGGNRTYKLNDVDLFCCCYSVNISQNDQNLPFRKDHSHSRKISTDRKFAENMGPVIKKLLGWAGVIWDGPWKIFGQFRPIFLCPRLGHQTKTHVCLLQKIKILIIKVNKTISKLSNANDAIEASTLFIQQQEVVESQQIQPTGEQLSINVLVKLGGIIMSIQCRVYLQCSYLQVFLL